MNVRGETRGAASKVKISDAYLRLRAEKGAGAVTVMELCAAAHVHRTTFYAYYSDVYDLRDRLDEDYARRLTDIFVQDGAKGLTDANAQLRAARFLRENAAYFAAAALRPLEKCAQALSARVEARAQACDAYAAYACEFALRGLLGLWEKWIETGFLAPEEEIARAACEMLRRALGERGFAV